MALPNEAERGLRGARPVSYQQGGARGKGTGGTGETCTNGLVEGRGLGDWAVTTVAPATELGWGRGAPGGKSRRRQGPAALGGDGGGVAGGEGREDAET